MDYFAFVKLMMTKLIFRTDIPILPTGSGKLLQTTTGILDCTSRLSYVSRYSELPIVPVISKITKHLFIHQDGMVISIIMRDITVVHYNFQFKYATRKIKPYIYSLTEGISSSKLSYARMLMSDKAFDDYNTKVIPTYKH